MSRKAHRRSSFIGDVTRIASGTAIAQVIMMLASPVLTRLFAPEAFGAAAAFTSVTSIVAVVACMRYEMAIVLPKDDAEAANLVAVSLLFVLGVSAVAGVIAFFAAGPLTRAAGMEQLAPFAWLAPVTILVQGVLLALNYWNTRTGHYSRLSYTRVAASGITVAGQMGAGAAGYPTGGAMITSTILGYLASTALLARKIVQSDGRFFLASVSWPRMKEAMARYRKFPLYGSWAGLLNAASWQLPVVMLAAFFSPTVVGSYALGFRIVQMPMSLIGAAVGQVFVQRAAVARLEGDLDELVGGLLRSLLLIGAFPIIELSLIGRDAFSVVFGARWADAGLYTQILAVWALVWFISSPMSQLFVVLERQELGLRINFFLFVSRLIALLVGGFSGNILLTIALFAGSGILVYGYQSLSVIRASGVPWRRLSEIGLECLKLNVPFVIALAAMLLLVHHPVAITLGAGVLMLLYLAAVVRFGHVMRDLSVVRGAAPVEAEGGG